MTGRPRLSCAVVTALGLTAWGCQLEPRASGQEGNLTDRHQVTERRAGPPPTTPAVAPPVEAPDDELLAEGRILYQQFNCAGCHAAGGGAIGPALMDDEWTYGSGLDNIFFTIVEGRPQGMPAFRGRIADGQVRTIARYVQSLSSVRTEPDPSPGATAGAAAPGALAEPSSAQRGREVFLQGPCALCHTIRGTPALATIGPDLTHLAGRTMIAAGTLQNTRGNLAGWILNPQNLKPGTKMPPTLLEAQDLHALLDYLESLK